MSEKTGRSRRAERARRRRRRQQTKVVALVAGAVVIVGVAVALVVVMTGNDDGDDVDATVAEVELFDFGISGDLTMPAGPVTLVATNVGAVPHNVGLRGVAISNEIAPGDSLELDLGELAPGEYELYCDIVGHQEAGMVADFLVT